MQLPCFQTFFLIVTVLRVDNSKAYSDLLSLRAEVDQVFTFLQSILFSCVNCVFRKKSENHGGQMNLTQWTFASSLGYLVELEVTVKNTFALVSSCFLPEFSSSFCPFFLSCCILQETLVSSKTHAEGHCFIVTFVF